MGASYSLSLLSLLLDDVTGSDRLRSDGVKEALRGEERFGAVADGGEMTDIRGGG